MSLASRPVLAVFLLSLGSAGEFARAAAFAVNSRAIQEVASGRRTTANASWWGYDPQDATAALQAAIHSGASKVIVEDMGTPWIVSPIQLAGDQEVVFEKGVVVQAKRGEFRAKNDALFTATQKKNVTLTGYGATLKMWRDDYDRPPYEHAEWRHVLNIRSCSHVRIAGLTLAESGGDGIYLGVAARGQPNSDVEIRDVVCDRNYRQGISVISAENLLIENTVLRDTAGTAPMAGIDFEPNHPSERLVNCVMRNCLAENNRSAGYVFFLKNLGTGSAPILIRLENCRSRGNRSGFRFITGNGQPRTAVQGSIEVVNCVFEDDQDAGIAVSEKPATGARVRFVNCQVINAALKQKTSSPILLTAGAGNTENVGGIEFVNCTVKDPIDRLPLKYVDMAGGMRLEDITGTLAVERNGRRTAYTIDKRQIDAWLPQQAYEDIPPFAAENVRYAPAFPDAPPRFRGAAGCRLREHAEYLLWVEAGRPAEFSVRIQPVGRGKAKPVPIRLISPSGKEKRLSDARGGEDTPYSFTPEASGAWRIVCEPAGSRCELFSTSHRVCLYSQKAFFHFIGTRGELFFWVPAGATKAALKIGGANEGERVKAAIYDPAGKKVDEKDNIGQAHQFLITRPASAEGGIWSVRLDRPSEGVLEDFYLQMQGLPPVLAIEREALLRPVESWAPRGAR
jgi:hypothetical protein